MKKTLLSSILALTLTLVVNLQAANVTINECVYSEEWTYTKGYHSDGTSASIRYSVDYSGNINEIEISYNGQWYGTYIKHDENGRRYVKNPNNKRYYF